MLNIICDITMMNLKKLSIEKDKCYKNFERNSILFYDIDT